MTDGLVRGVFSARVPERPRRSKTGELVNRTIVVVDNYDSFTYNLVQYVASLGANCQVRLNDRVTTADIRALEPHGILLSPGPGTPDDAGVTLDVIRELSGETPLFGVCLGLQSIGQAFGGKVIRAPRLMHGKTSPIEHDGRGVFAGVPNPFQATRYHSLVVEEASLPDCLEVSARTPEGEIMGIRHKTLPVEGVQFHPESILTEHGLDLVQNWLNSLGRA
jgi:anthranilate synthase component 2